MYFRLTLNHCTKSYTHQSQVRRLAHVVRVAEVALVARAHDFSALLFVPMFSQLLGGGLPRRALFRFAIKPAVRNHEFRHFRWSIILKFILESFK